MTEEEKRCMEGLLDQLNDRERSVVEKVYGLNGNKASSYEEVSRLTGIPFTRVKQVTSKVIRKVRRAV